MKPLPICIAYTAVFVASFALWGLAVGMILLLPWPWLVAVLVIAVCAVVYLLWSLTE